MNAQAAEVIQSEEPPWLVRAYDAERDANALHYLLGISYTRSWAGWRAGANRAGGSVERGKAPAKDTDTVSKQKSFMAAHSPVWTWLLENADTKLVVDPENPHIIWAWLITSGPNVIHAAGAKRTFTKPDESTGYRLSSDILRELLGDRLRACSMAGVRDAHECTCVAHQVTTLELPQMRTRGNEAIGLDRPKTWSMDPTWLLTRMVGR